MAQSVMIGGKPGRQRMWEAIRTLKTFSVEQVAKKARCEEPATRTYLRNLKTAGFLHAEERTYDANNLPQPLAYTLMKDNGVEAPRVNAQGELVVLGRKFEVIWRTLRRLKETDVAELLSYAQGSGLEISRSAVNTYLGALNKAGYLEQSRTGSLALRYRLKPKMDTGPRPPQIQKIKAVYDPNLNKVMHAEDPEELS